MALVWRVHFPVVACALGEPLYPEQPQQEVSPFGLQEFGLQKSDAQPAGARLPFVKENEAGRAMTPESELLEIFAGYRRRVDELAVWSADATRVHALLQMATRPRAESLRRGLDLGDFPWETLIDLMLEWHYSHPEGTNDCLEKDVFDALLLATVFTRIVPLESGIRTGVFRVRRTGNDFRVLHRWDIAPEVADLYLERNSRVHTAQVPSPAEMEWAAVQPRGRLNAFDPPIDLLRAVAGRAVASMQAWREAQPEGYLADDFDLGDGLDVHSMVEVLSVLMAITELGELAHAKIHLPGTMLFHARRSTLIGWLEQLCEDSTVPQLEIALDRLTVGPGRSVRRSLLVPNGEIITILPLLLFPRAFDSLMLRTAAYDPGRYGPIGQRQGNRARAWAVWLRAIPGTQVAERLKVRNAAGKTVGDLDVVALDSSTTSGVIFEVKWPIDAVTLPEVLKTDDAIVAAARQLGQVRRLIATEEADVELPRGWPAFREVDWTWCVGTPQQLTTRPLPEPGITATSMRYLASLDVAGRLTDVIELLNTPDWPKVGDHYVVRKTTLELDRHRLHVDSIHMRDVDWLPRLRHRA